MTEPSEPRLPMRWGIDPKATLEERARQAVAVRELEMDVSRLRKLAWLALLGWIGFAFFDYVQASFLGVTHLRELLTIRAVVAGFLVALTIWGFATLHTSARRVSVVVVLAGVIMTSGVSVMCLYTGGFEALYAAGILLTTMVVVVVPRPFPVALTWITLSLVPYPIILWGSALFVPEMREALHSRRAIGYAIQYHFVGLVWALVLPSISHMLWSIRRELFEAQSVGQYRLTRLLGRGGMGEVWAAFHRGLRRDVAVKILQKQNEQDEVATRRFEREVRAMAGLTHPNTVRLFDYGVADDGRLYYAMELLEGDTLTNVVRADGALSPERAVHLLTQASHALGEAHALGIVHRDVKPENLFVTTMGGQRDFVKVLDFGIASVLDADLAVTRTGVVTGTPATMSPEVISGDEATPASDVYALGTVGYFLLTGQYPFGDRRGNAALTAHLHEVPVPPSTRLGRRLPHDVEEIVLRCLEKSPADRYADGMQLARALVRCSTANWRPSLTPTPMPKAPSDTVADAAERSEERDTRAVGRKSAFPPGHA